VARGEHDRVAACVRSAPVSEVAQAHAADARRSALQLLDARAEVDLGAGARDRVAQRLYDLRQAIRAHVRAPADEDLARCVVGHEGCNE
jgi:hypothetical protein